MKKFLITYSERRSITREVEAQTPDEAFDFFHNQRDFQENDWEYWGEETEVDPIEESPVYYTFMRPVEITLQRFQAQIPRDVARKGEQAVKEYIIEKQNSKFFGHRLYESVVEPIGEKEEYAVDTWEAGNGMAVEFEYDLTQVPTRDQTDCKQGDKMRKVVIRSEFERYESAINELKGIGTDEEHWLHAEPRTDKWFHYIVCALRHNTITPHMFMAMDEKPGRWCYTQPYETWHWKLRSCRNHPEWSKELFGALEQNAVKVYGEE